MKRMVFILALLAMLVAPVAAQDDMALPDFITHTECEVDLTGQTIPLYHFGDISAAYAPITQPLLTGIADALEYFNAHGGACGATLEQINLDTANDLERTQAIFDDFKTRDPKPLLFLLYASPDAELLRDQLAEEEIPVMISAGSIEGLYGEAGNEPGWIFATNPLYVDQLGSFCDYVAEHPDEFPADPKIGYISWPGAFGQAAFTAETMGYCADLGIGFSETPEIFLPAAPDVITNVQNLLDDGVNIFYTNTLASGPPVIARTLIELGVYNDVVLAGVNWIMDSSAGLIDQQTRNDVGLPAVSGMYGSMPFGWWTEAATNPGIAFVSEQFAMQAEAKGRDAVAQARLRNIAYLLGWTSVDIYIELIAQTANRTGAEGLNGAAVYETLSNLQYDSMGIQTLDFTEGQRATRLNRIVRYGFLNADGTGAATSAEDANTGAGLFLPIVVPLEEFNDAPDLRPNTGE